MPEVDNEDYVWQPPSEAEMKIIQARRERSDKISKIMGDYLLKGYKMLGSVCTLCETILLEDKLGQQYCIACRELDTDADKDDPVVNEAAARSMVAEKSQIAEESSGTRTSTQIEQSGSSHRLTNITHVDVQPSQRTNVTSSSLCRSTINSDAVDTLCDKIKLASDELKQTSSIEYSIQLCNLIKASADAIQSLKSANLTED